MFKILWSREEKPTPFEDTVLIQLYKGKGYKSNLYNHRNIHTKHYLPKVLESIIVGKSKKNRAQMKQTPNRCTPGTESPRVPDCAKKYYKIIHASKRV